MRYTISFTSVLIIFCQVGCNTLALLGKPPKLDSCQLNVTNIEGNQYKVIASCLNQNQIRFDLPINKLDKYQCFEPQQLSDVLTYAEKGITLFLKEFKGKK